MLVQRTLTKNPRAEAWMELLELISGLFLALFIQMHILAVSNILFGAAAFDHKSVQMDEYFVSHIAIFLGLCGHSRPRSAGHAQGALAPAGGPDRLAAF